MRRTDLHFPPAEMTRRGRLRVEGGGRRQPPWAGPVIGSRTMPSDPRANVPPSPVFWLYRGRMRDRKAEDLISSFSTSGSRSLPLEVNIS